jgi:hypothetical protein
VRSARDHVARHDVADGLREHLRISRHLTHDVSFRDDPDEIVRGVHHHQGADIVLNQGRHGRFDRVLGPDRDHVSALGRQDACDIHLRWQFHVTNDSISCYSRRTFRP